ncbi:hypothetical protein WDZ17_12865 [Pseudokineococcus basanitobsidens]|uniref:Uncharacterized protein n=1 Tax=Pseudokineococcus basanitobsidens TaxID=1926649 RepID=A0ABU8RMD6_9ACTN
MTKTSDATWDEVVEAAVEVLRGARVALTIEQDDELMDELDGGVSTPEEAREAARRAVARVEVERARAVAAKVVGEALGHRLAPGLRCAA